MAHADGRAGTARVRAAASAARRVLGAAPSGLFVDIDGTLSHMAPRPEDATVSPAIRRALERLAESVAVVTAVTGRGVEDARTLICTDAIGYVCNNCLECRHGCATSFHPLAVPYVDRLGDTLYAL